MLTFVPEAIRDSPSAEGEEVVCHGDLGSHNIVFDGEEAVALIDWGVDVAPGPRLTDFAHAVWCCADVCEEDVDVHEQARKVRLMCDAYDWEDVAAVIEEIAARFRRARDEHAAARRTEGTVIFERMVSWIGTPWPGAIRRLLSTVPSNPMAKCARGPAVRIGEPPPRCLPADPPRGCDGHRLPAADL